MALIQDKKTGEWKKLEGKEKKKWLETDAKKSVAKKMGFLNEEQMRRHKEIRESKRQSRQEYASKNPTKSKVFKDLRLL